MTFFRWESRGIPKGEVSAQSHLDAVNAVLSDVYLQETKIWEMFMINVDRIEALVRAEIERNSDSSVKPEEKDIQIIQDPEYRRFNSGVNIKNAAKIFRK